MSEQARIETAVEMTIDNCEVLRARLAKYEDADGNPKAKPARAVLPEPLKRGDEGGSGEYGGAMIRGYNACLREVARLNQPASAGDENATLRTANQLLEGEVARLDSLLFEQAYRLERALDAADKAALYASHGEQVREWVPVSDRLPETKDGTEADFIVAIRRAHNGKTYVVPASFLNRFELYSEDEAADDEGRIYVTGWYREMADDEYDTAWHKMETEGDVITHWQELPATPSAGSQGGDV